LKGCPVRSARSPPMRVPELLLPLQPPPILKGVPDSAVQMPVNSQLPNTRLPTGPRFASLGACQIQFVTQTSGILVSQFPRFQETWKGSPRLPVNAVSPRVPLSRQWE